MSQVPADGYIPRNTPTPIFDFLLLTHTLFYLDFQACRGNLASSFLLVFYESYGVNVCTRLYGL